MRVALVACSARKSKAAARAEDLYEGTLYRAARAVARGCDRWFIVSALHGLLAPDQLVEPYEHSLVTASRATRRAWVERVAPSLAALRPATLVVMAGANYRDAIRGGATIIPRGMERIGIGSQVRRLQEGGSSMSKVLVVGVAPGPNAGALRPLVGSSSGAALEQLWGLQPGELGAVADTANLYPSWPGAAPGGLGDLVPPAAALEQAAKELDVTGYEVVILCGRPVAEAMGFDYRHLATASDAGVVYLMLPHPSRVNRWWNVATNRAAARDALNAVAPLARDLLGRAAS